MNANALKSQALPILHLIGLALVIVALAKFAGVRVSFVGGSITEAALVGAGLLLAR